MSRETLDAEGPGQLPGPVEDVEDVDDHGEVRDLGAVGVVEEHRDAERGDVEGGALDGLAADLGEDRIDPKVAARLPGERLTSLDLRGIRLVAAAVGAVLLLVLTAVGGYSEGQKARTRGALTGAEVVSQTDQSLFQLQRDQDGRLAEPIPVTMHLTLTATASVSLVRLVLPIGVAEPSGPVRLEGGPGTQVRFELRDLCGRPGDALRPDNARTTATVRTADGTEVVLPLLLGNDVDLLGHDFFCASGVDPRLDVPVSVDRMTTQVDGTLRVTLASRSDRPVTVEPVQSPTSNTGPFSWKVSLVPRGGAVLVPARGSATMVIRLTAPTCFPDRSVAPGNGLVALRIATPQWSGRWRSWRPPSFPTGTTRWWPAHPR
jgi:hypothetical protein